MPRSSSRRSAPAPAPAARRPMSTTASPPAHRQAPPPPVPAQQQPVIVQGQQPSLFGQMASTAAGVAVGSTVGHALGGALGGIFGGGSSSAPAVEQPQAAAPLAPQQSSYAYNSNNQQASVCDVDARNFTKCLDDNNGNMQICDWYLQQLKACQEMSRNY
ncbi:hypothetical protein V1525DRAFT_457249 [Lipomyces kononenkoae]|uniref:Uncharacterized protein n=1 Tax=Lipomyces kononenkoae TaxID=34357 RepID=A0ACC3T1G9_LIPKO